MVDGISEHGATHESAASGPITPHTPEWNRNLDIALPIDVRDIPNFSGWVNWNDFNLDTQVRKKHNGFDFAAYYTKDGKIVFGLPKGLPIRAVADGTVVNIRTWENHMAYYNNIEIEHGHSEKMSTLGSGLLSDYVHVLPRDGLENNQQVKKGDVIGFLYTDNDINPEGNNLTHLHLSLLNRDRWEFSSPNADERFVNPAKIFPHLTDHDIPVGQKGRPEFTVPSLARMPITIGNGFTKILPQTRN